MQPRSNERERIGLPPRPFLYTVDQIAALLELKEQTLKTKYMYFIGRSTGPMHSYYMKAHNIAPTGDRAVWRVAEEELMRWLKMKGFKIYEARLVRY